MNVEMDICKIIKNCKSAAESWLILDKAFLTKDNAYHLQVYSDFRECKLDNNKSVGFYTAWISQLNKDLKKLDQNLEIKCMVFQSIQFLSKKFDHAFQCKLYSPQKHYTFTKVSVKLMVTEQWINYPKTKWFVLLPIFHVILRRTHVVGCVKLGYITIALYNRKLSYIFWNIKVFQLFLLQAELSFFLAQSLSSKV